MTNFYTGKLGNEYWSHRMKSRHVDDSSFTASKFTSFVSETDIVLDFGCGTGEVLDSINASTKIGIEINEPSLAIARQKSLSLYTDLSEIPSCSIDLAITHHALEHVSDPYPVLQQLYRVLKREGRFVGFVPAEICIHPRFFSWSADPNHHIFSWTPLSFGNLVQSAGFLVSDCRLMLNPTPGSWTRPFAKVPLLFRTLTALRVGIRGVADIRCVARKND